MSGMAMSAEIMARLLGEGLSGLEVLTLGETDSTNEEARRRIMSGNTGEVLITTEKQNAGRGRMGRSFYSPEGTGLYMTLVLSPRPAANCLMLTTAAAVAVYRAIKELTGVETDIKWVNDIYFEGKKICGILTEAVEKDGLMSALVGVGVNIGTGSFPEELRLTAGALGRDVSREALACAIAVKLLDMAGMPEDRSYMEDYRKRCFVTGREVDCFENGLRTFSGRVEAVENDGTLIVSGENGAVRRLSTGEITLRVR